MLKKSNGYPSFEEAKMLFVKNSKKISEADKIVKGSKEKRANMQNSRRFANAS